ncbi:MAG: hypothetical protein FWE85_04495, partial [Clostridiales bacterium]|nr:hypothetical protein [Clostridiales bacterium]
VYSKATLSGNIAFSGMDFGGNGIVGANEIDGADLSAAQISADGALGGRFTAKGGWTVEDGKLPGLGAPVDLPEHIK